MDKRKKSTSKDRALHRAKIIKGHIAKLESMLAEGAYCVDVVHQSRAIQSALKKMDALLIENHLKCCVVSQMKNNQEQKASDELLQLFAYK